MKQSVIGGRRGSAVSASEPAPAWWARWAIQAVCIGGTLCATPASAGGLAATAGGGHLQAHAAQACTAAAAPDQPAARCGAVLAPASPETLAGRLLGCSLACLAVWLIGRRRE